MGDMPFIKKYWKQAFALVISLAVILGIAHYTTETGLPYFTNALVVWGTLVLATAAFLTIRNSNEREKRRRKEELAREGRDRKERLLNEIIEWAIDITKCGLEHWSKDVTSIMGVLEMNRSLEEDDIYKKLDWSIFSQLSSSITVFTAFRGKNEYIRKVAEAFGQSLAKDVAKLAKSLESHIDILEKCLTAPNIKSKLGAPPRHKKKIDKLAFKVIEEAVKIKTQELLN